MSNIESPHSLNGAGMTRSMTKARTLALLAAALLLSACQYAVLDPAGDVARQQRDII